MWYSILKLSGILFLLLQLPPSCRKNIPDPQRVQLEGKAQGTTYRIIYLHPQGLSYKDELDSLLREIDESFSLYLPASLINRFNRSEKGLPVDDRMKELVRRALQVSRESGGAFDITVKPLVDAWGFGVERHTRVPDSSHILELMQHVGYRLLELKGDSLLKRHPGVEIDANGIAQGYSLDLLAAFLEERGVKDYLVELGGEIRVRGRNEKGVSWRIGIESPPQAGETQAYTRVLELSGKGLSTSGNYRRFYESGGKHYAHTIDPRSGFPAQNRLISVTVVADDCMSADAWDNALMVWGLKKSLAELKGKDLEAYFIYTDEKGQVRDTSTAGFPRFFSSKP